LGIRILPLIGFQWPPPWIGEEHRLGYQPRTGSIEISPIASYADPYVRERLARYVRAVVSRYRGERTIDAWVLGNEFSYLEYATQRQLGHDAATLAAFREDLRRRYRD